MENIDKAGWISQISVAGWVCMAVVAVVLIVLAFILVSKILKEKNLVTPAFSLTEKTQIMAESRELSDNQMRGAKEILGYIGVELRHEADMSFIDQDMLEKAYLNKVFEIIILELLEQFRIDLVRNHIVKRNEQELKEYTAAKAEIYYKMVQSILSECNDEIPRFSLPSLLDNIPESEFYELYYKAYLNAKRLSSGY